MRPALIAMMVGLALAGWLQSGGSADAVATESCEVGLVDGWNTVVNTGPAIDAATLASSLVFVDAILRWNAAQQTFESFSTGVPTSLNTMATVNAGDALWIRSSAPVLWSMPSGNLSTNILLDDGWNFVPWLGTSTPPATAIAAFESIVVSLNVFDSEAATFNGYQTGLPPNLNTLSTLLQNDAVWVFLSPTESFLWDQSPFTTDVPPVGSPPMDAGPAPTIESVVCSPSQTFVAVQTTCRAQVSGTSTTTSWATSGGSPRSGTGPTFVTSYLTAGLKSIEFTACNGSACSTKLATVSVRAASVSGIAFHPSSPDGCATSITLGPASGLLASDTGVCVTATYTLAPDTLLSIDWTLDGETLCDGLFAATSGVIAGTRFPFCTSNNLHSGTYAVTFSLGGIAIGSAVQFIPLESIPPPTSPPAGTITGTLDGSFEGWQHGRIFKLLGGTYWRQTSFDFSFEFIFSPRVTLLPGLFGFTMVVDGADGSATVERLTLLADTCIASDFDGFDFGNIYVLCNGQVWEQTSFRFRFRFAFRPDVLIFTTGFGAEMWVEGIEDTIRVVRIG